MSCECKYVFKCEPSYIPDYSNIGTTGGGGTVLAPVQQFECLCCGNKYGYVPYHSKLIEKPEFID